VLGNWKKYPAIDYKGDRKISRLVMPEAVKEGLGGFMEL